MRPWLSLPVACFPASSPVQSQQANHLNIHREEDEQGSRGVSGRLTFLFRGNAKGLSSSLAWALVILPVTVYYQLSSLISSAYELTQSMIH